MSVAALDRPQRVNSPTPLLVGLALAASIAWVEPFDRVFASLTFGQPAIRSSLIVILALVGARAARAIGLRLRPWPAANGVSFALVLGAAVGLMCLGCDFAFRAFLNASYVLGLVDTPLVVRVVVFMAHVFNEEVLYRLFLGSILAWTLMRWTTTERARTRAMWCGLCLAQAVNVVVNVMSRATPGPIDLAYDVLRFFAPGLIWSWLYVRKGFGAAVIGHMSAHVAFQPLIGLVLA